MKRSTTALCVVTLVCGFLLLAVRSETELVRGDPVASVDGGVSGPSHLGVVFDATEPGSPAGVGRWATWVALLSAVCVVTGGLTLRRHPDEAGNRSVGRFEAAPLRAPPLTA